MQKNEKKGFFVKEFENLVVYKILYDLKIVFYKKELFEIERVSLFFWLIIIIGRCGVGNMQLMNELFEIEQNYYI